MSTDPTIQTLDDETPEQKNKNDSTPYQLNPEQEALVQPIEDQLKLSMRALQEIKETKRSNSVARLTTECDWMMAELLKLKSTQQDEGFVKYLSKICGILNEAKSEILENLCYDESNRQDSLIKILLACQKVDTDDKGWKDDIARLESKLDLLLDTGVSHTKKLNRLIYLS